MNEYYSTPSASTLHPKSRPYDDHQDAVDQAIENFQKLNSKQKERYLGMVQSMMADAGTGKGTFGPVLHAPYQNSAGVGKVIKQEGSL